MGRSTFEIKLGDETFEGRTTFEAIDAFESKAGIAILDAWVELGSTSDAGLATYKFTPIATAIWAAINGERKVQGQQPMIWETVGQMVQEYGFINCRGYASTFFSHSMPEQKGEFKETEEAEKKSIE